MRPSRYVVLGFAVLATAATAEEFEPEEDYSEPEYECSQKDIPAELAQLCDSLDLGYANALARPAKVTGSGRPDLRPSLARKPIKSEIIGGGLSSTPTLDRLKNPFDGPAERSVGVKIDATGAPIQLSTRMIQPGTDDDPALNWELKAENQTDKSGFFMGAATSGWHSSSGFTENVAGFAGVRRVLTPADGMQIRAEIAPRFGVSDFASPHASAVLEPKLTATSNLGQLGNSDFVGSIDANAGYSVPFEGDPSAWGGFRFLVKPK